MENSVEEKQTRTLPNPKPDQDEHLDPSDAKEDENDVVDDDEEEDEDEVEEQEPPSKPLSREAQLRAHKSKMEDLFLRMQNEKVNLRVHDVLIKGNTKTKEWLIEAELEGLKSATTLQGLLEAAGIANARLQQFDIFDSVRVTLDSGPPELPGTANVIVEVVETNNPLSGECGAYMKTTARSWTVEGSLKYKNWFGHGDVWDGSVAYGPNQTSEVSAGVFLPRFKGLLTPVLVRVSLLSQDWQEFSSYKERLLGLSLGLLSTRHHDLVYNLGWRTLTDPSKMSSRSVRRQLGHSLLSSLKYTFKIDRRNSPVRPIKGYAFVSTTQVGGLAPDHRSLRFLRQELDLRYAVPFGFYHAALNFGISGGVIFPCGRGFLDKPSPLPERFFLGGDFSPICTLGGPTTVWGFKTRGLGPTEPRRQIKDKPSDENSDFPGRDFLGGDLAVTAFADLSFDLPIKWLRDRGIHGHIFAGAGNLAKLTENEFWNFSFRKFLESFRSSVGVGIVVPTKLFRLEGNFYYIVKQHDHDRGKTGFRFSFSAPS
ncbi:sorting and assembly machinery component 50 homolog B-like [Juglans microcarpa x Juglans regia]|uniref:sorting and assembly machinery component 50 homolog B-like n=1 Tax=Juglans microcarpa x Juglans regia TaxID=2249226 RepID=UPI001B7DE319|nr:sorting and assembly machinery component 50 homolog B-like [Juglans microcarpa x Juglans regia]